MIKWRLGGGNSVFQEQKTEKYCFVNHKGRIMCVIHMQNVTCTRKAQVEMTF